MNSSSFGYMKVGCFVEAQIGSDDLGLKPIILMTGSPKLRNFACSSVVNETCSPPNLYAFRISVFSIVLAVSSAIWVVVPFANAGFSPPSQT